MAKVQTRANSSDFAAQLNSVANNTRSETSSNATSSRARRRHHSSQRRQQQRNASQVSTMSRAKDDDSAVLHSANFGSKSSFSQMLVVNRLANPPEKLKHIKDEGEKQLVVMVLCHLCSRSKSTKHLVHGIEDCTSFYKVFSSGFRERITMDDMFSIYQLNRQIGWMAIRDIYVELDPRRLVVEVNKETTRQYQPPLESAIQRYEEIIQNEAHAANGRTQKASGRTLRNTDSRKRRRYDALEQPSRRILIAPPPFGSVPPQQQQNYEYEQEQAPQQQQRTSGVSALFNTIKSVMQDDDTEASDEEEMLLLPSHQESEPSTAVQEQARPAINVQQQQQQYQQQQQQQQQADDDDASGSIVDNPYTNTLAIGSIHGPYDDDDLDSEHS